MALLEFDGFDDLAGTVWGQGWEADTGDTSVMTATTGRSRIAGGKSIYYNSSSSSRYVVRRFTALHPAQTDFGFGVGLLNTSVSVVGDLIRVMEGSTIHVIIYRDTNGFLQIRNGASTVLATSATGGYMNIDTWVYLVVEVKIADAGGYVKVWANGSANPVVEVSGVDTRNGGTGQCDRVGFQCSGSSRADYHRIDDWYLYDLTGPAPYNANLGECRIVSIIPNGNGASSQFTGSDGNSTDNYLLVDDEQVSTDYVASSTTGHRDLYEMTDPSVDATYGQVYAVQARVHAAKSDSGTAKSLLTVQRASTGEVVTGTAAAAAALSTTYQLFRGPVRTTSPSGAGWTPSNVNSLQMGVELGS